ncbi:hypothetical protein [uncultured Anaerococcus sp.]|uniref:hypothetical protein n=1 Tax=uncultured Anaerococcus sp. TaxID=293428 RepID=UPI002611B42F|nr:hypothetical protein [uncultured Anaerococcus sp.]
MDTYNITFSEDTKIGAAYDQFHHEIAQVSKHDDDAKIEFRSKDFIANIKKDSSDSISVLLENNKDFKIFKEDEITYIEINGDKIDTSSDEFTLEDKNGKYDFYLKDHKNLDLKTESSEIVLAIVAGLSLIAFINQI